MLSTWGPWAHSPKPPQPSSVAQLYLTLCNPMDSSMPGFPIINSQSLLTHIHRVSDDIQPSHPLSSPSPPAFNLSQHQGLFQGISSSHLVAFTSGGWSFSISSFNEYSGLISLRMDWFDLPAVQGTLKSSPTPQSKSINSSALSFLYSPTLTSIHDYWKNHSFDWMDLCHQSNVSAFLIRCLSWSQLFFQGASVF